ncbi:MAG: family N-acetyltransferase [Clostridiales bacterium]|jgi:aminoglycoside 6'-N-acetyltransferase I|nr:family N-acetyltransferase [Clostridiales bacterium]
MIRKVELEDVKVCAEIFSEAYSGEPWNHRWPIDRAVEYLMEYFRYGKFIGYVVCDEDNKICAGLFAHERTWFNGSEIYIDEVFVKPGMQGKGLATKLINKAKGIVKENNMLGLTLMTHRGYPAEKVYQKNDFVADQHLMFMEFDANK